MATSRVVGMWALVLALAAGLLAGCGGDADTAPPPGSPENPLVGKRTSDTDEGAARSAEPGFDAIVKRQSRKPQLRFTPCNLVTKGRARTILGVPIEDPVEAPQGPTCVYRTQDGERFITLAVQSQPIGRLLRQLSDRRAVDVDGRTAYCGRFGQPLLHLPISSGRVLTVAARCATARRFAIDSLAGLSR